MAIIHQLREHDNIAIIGWSCRLPGANSIESLWKLLVDGKCAISQVPPDRFPLQRFGHPRRQERGKTYTWAAGVLDDVWGFDPSVFGISPREAEQMDPQQRILLQLTWEALEDAGIPPSSLAGSETGVFVGGSQTDYAHSMFADYAIADPHFATGNALAVLANRVSYIFDLHGPSVTIDTACSSSLVALHQACEALRSGRVDTAIVGGVNVITSAAEFVSFSQASMLSPTGLCHAFSADADGYVRAEGGAVLVLRRASQVAVGATPVHGLVLTSDVNSDGRTNGISLPSATMQAALLDRVYSRAGIDPERLAFVEAHGTGTPVGDPIEAESLGRTLGRGRSAPLPIGSIKTNIGHTEAASGLAGLLKAALSLRHGVFPRSLHASTPNPAIPFEDLNLSVCANPLPLGDVAGRCAGVNSFGFGGTNAHVVIAPAEQAHQQHAGWRPAGGGGFFALTAATKASLTALAAQYADRLPHMSDGETARLAGAIAHRRDNLVSRAIISTTRAHQVTEALNALVAGSDDPRLTTGTAIGSALPVGFVYSGNGSQWVGMGITAHRHNPAFRTQFDLVDEYFREMSGWSLKEAMFDETLGRRLDLTSVAQPLIFAIQSASTAALRARGLQPVATIGHSVGEVAAAEAAGALDSRSAAEVIYFRSKHQELVNGAGRMAAVLSSLEDIEYTLAEVEGVEIAAVNSPRAITVAGSAEGIASLKKLASGRGIALLDLGLDYPFHTAAMTPVRAPLLTDLRDLRPHDSDVAFISTVSGSVLPGGQLGASYWWRNVREPVQFLAGVREMVKLGVRFFVEIGPRSTLLRHIADNPAVEAEQTAMLALLDRNDQERDPVDRVVSRAFVSGVCLDTSKIFGSNPGIAVSLPSYPWQQRSFRYAPTQEAIGAIETERHPFSGVRGNSDELVWRAHIDTALFPALADHRVGEQIIFPGTGYLEIAFAVASEWLGTKQMLLTNFEILNPLDLTNGETRELMTRVSPNSNTIEIFSRPRLSQASWTQHCRAKTFHADTRTGSRRPDERGHVRTVLPETIYRTASACGLEYGPAFRLLSGVKTADPGIIRVDLMPNADAAPFVLDPVRLDACCHGLITVFSELRAEERGVSYLPVRLDEATLYLPGVAPQQALIEVLSKNERAIVANYTFFGADGAVVAVLRGVYCQVAQIKRPANLETASFIELPQLIDGAILGNTGLAVGVDAILGRARAAGLLGEPATSPSEAGLLVEGCAMAAAYEIAVALAEETTVDVDALIGGGRLPPELRGWLGAVLGSLEAAGLAENIGGRWTMIGDPLFPSTASVVKELASEHPDCAAELMIAGVFSGLAAHAVQHRAILVPAETILTPTVLDFYDLSSKSLAEASDFIARLIEDDIVLPRNRSVRVLQLGHGPLTSSLLALQQRRDITLTLLEPDRRRCDTARRAIAANGNIALVEQESVEGLGEFDLVVAVDCLYRLPATLDLAELRKVIAPRGVLIAAETYPSVFRDMAVGLELQASPREDPGYATRRLQGPETWLASLDHAGFINNRSHVLRAGCGLSSLILAETAATITPRAVAPVQRCTIVLAEATGTDARIAAELLEQLRRQEIDAEIVSSVRFSDPAPDTVIHFVGMGLPQPEAMDLLTRRCMAIKTCVERFGSAPAVIWHLYRGALPSGVGKIDPLATAVWAFSRTVGNEFPALDIRRVDIAPQLAPSMVAARLREIIVSNTPETELQIDETSIRAVRVDRIKRVLDRTPLPHIPAIRLQRRLSSGQRLQWEVGERVRPAANEVEIAVEATGLNFRDLMWSLSLLSDDIIEDGVAGATLGCECAGRVVQVGPGVRHLQRGDRVVALGGATFATHVTVAAACVAKLPETISTEAGATVPVAFLTAYYSLVTQARLKRGEWVLIHGGAGGVGMAAAQIARICGAKIIATAGSTAKRDLLTALGADHVLDSRSNTFAEDVRSITGAGVDVVLNSLAGEAMERGISCLRPFGRFVEIGKRDYISNTHIGLRPFRKNLTYFGIDIDQLMLGQGDVGQKAFARVMKQLENGELTPLPYTVFKAEEIHEAFHLMQHSGHIGKIVVTPPGPELVVRPTRSFAVNPGGTHVITGGFGGFGWEAAKWLVDHGARHLVLLGRRGAAGEEAKAGLAELAARGVRIYAEPCDIADRRAVERVFEHIHQTMPPVVGVLHTAMVLDDGLLANLDEDRFHRVLAPKVIGADNLDQLTRGMPLDYFVLFSSATTLVGNPGQGNYVAANAYMEGIARRRRQEGLKALAVGWGPITDVGVLARSERLRARFQKLIGVRGMRARDALDLMARALEQPQTANLAVMTISPTEGIFTADRLPVLASPTYASMVRGDQAEPGRLAHNVDLYALARTEGIESVQRTLTDIIVVQLAHILHAREEDIPRVRPLSEIGVDSLMAIEVAMNLEETIGIHMSLTSTIGNLTVGGLANELIAQLDLERGDTVAKSFAEQHVQSVGPEQIAILAEIVNEAEGSRGRALH
ncbi:MAG TPA: SDR family NAD(P)-dependent oxidoreductase [Stellaceae bacterium]|nr:SDR family NAD(P)-dependent oxidoreductase [Stellaceae bacterium]